MRYKYKGDIRACLIPISAVHGTEVWEEASDELECAYYKAALYDQNKAKIEAFDEIVKEYERNQSYADFREAVVMIIDDTQLIQGEQDQ